jgi:hypothetical protein
MKKCRRALTMVVAGAFVFGAQLFSQQPASRPVLSPADKARTEKVANDELRVEELKKALADAKTKAAASASAFDALAAYDEAVVAFTNYFEANGGTAGRPVVDLYKDLLAASDALVDKAETPEHEASVPARDMLSSSARALWGESVGVSADRTSGYLTITGVEIPGIKVTGVCSLLPPKAAPWHDLSIDLEFTIVEGGFEMYLRYEQAKKSYRINFKPSEGYELNKPYRMTVKVKGSSISLKAPDLPENRDRLDAAVSRTGGIGFGIAAGSKVTISRLMVKVLR